LPRYAISENDKVVNVIVAEASFIKESKIKATECGDEVCVGWNFDGKKFIVPEPVFETIYDETIPQ